MNICPFLCPLSKGSLNRTTAKYEELGIKCLLLRLQGCPQHTGQFSKIPTRAHPPHPEQSPSPAPLLHSCGDEWRDDSAVAEMTGTQPINHMFVAKHTKFPLSHSAEVSLSSQPVLSCSEQRSAANGSK